MNWWSVSAIIRALDRSAGGCLVLRLVCLGKELIRHFECSKRLNGILGQPGTGISPFPG